MYNVHVYKIHVCIQVYPSSISGSSVVPECKLSFLPRLGAPLKLLELRVWLFCFYLGIRTFIFLCICEFVQFCAFVFVCLWICLSVYLWIFAILRFCICVFVNLCTCVFLYLCNCVFAYYLCIICVLFVYICVLFVYYLSIWSSKFITQLQFWKGNERLKSLFTHFEKCHEYVF